MDGILDELLRLENAKRHALINLDSVCYEDTVREQTRVAGNLRIDSVARPDVNKLLAFSRLARLNSILYTNLLSTSSWYALANRGYTGNGQTMDVPARGRFSAEA